MSGAGDVRQLASHASLYVRTWSPGDGATRYRFFRFVYSEDEAYDCYPEFSDRPTNDYFGPDDAMYTAVGAADAVAFLRGYMQGKAHRAVVAEYDARMIDAHGARPAERRIASGGPAPTWSNFKPPTD